MTSIRLLAPLSGQTWPLERIPDPVFAQKMVGDGISIDPTDAVLLAPCAGEIVTLHAAGHAVTLRTAEGAEILMHIGIDTVALKGEGFVSKVKVGDRVATGAPLIAFDLDFLATRARSLLTQIIVTNCDQVTAWEPATGLVVAGKDTLLTVAFEAGTPAETAVSEANAVVSEPITIPNPTGLHARPAAVLSSLAKAFKSTAKLQLGDRYANARSVTSIMALEIGHGAKVQVRRDRFRMRSGRGGQALRKLLAQGCGRRRLHARPRAGDHHGCSRFRLRPRNADPPTRMCSSASPLRRGSPSARSFQVRARRSR
jgi:phosphotransferase system HPr (HPr) family protein